MTPDEAFWTLEKHFAEVEREAKWFAETGQDINPARRAKAVADINTVHAWVAVRERIKPTAPAKPSP